jgi:hypothetical protein
MKTGTKKLFVAALSTLTVAVCANAQNLNGTLNTGFYGSPVSVQTVNSGFGDATGGDGSGGSELDAVYTQVSGGNLYIFIAGDFQNNGNHLNVFVAGGAGGQNTLAVPTTATLQAMNGSVFPSGFQATWAFDMNDSGGTLYSEEYNLTGTPSGGYVGSLAETGTGIAAGSDGGVASLYLNNTHVSTMGTSGAALSGATSGANTTTGLEIVVPLTAIGNTGGPISVIVDINGGGDGYLSNQFLPGLPVGTGNPGGTKFNFGIPFENGTLDSAFYGAPMYIQTINTGFGDSTGSDGTGGSELDAVYAKVTTGYLYLFVAGDFQNNGNHLNLFVAGGASGQNTLNVPATATLQAMNGSIFTNGFQATWAYDMNDSGGTLYSEEYNLTGTPSGGYVGSLAETGNGIAAGSDGGVASLYLNNNNVSTMGASGTALTATSNTGANTTTGLEIAVPLADIGYTGGAINLLVDINGGGDGYLSNQLLPGLPVGSGNLGTPTFNLSPIPTPTNTLTFTLDMSEQIAFGNFQNTDPDPTSPTFGQYTNSVTMDGFNDGLNNYPMTNYTVLNPGDLNPGIKTNWYLGTYPLISFLPTTIQWKFRVNNLDGGYEQPASTAGNNRTTNITQQVTVLPVISYDDEGIGDLVPSNTIAVNFSILCTNGTPDDTGIPFQKGSDTLWINGAWLGWPAWSTIGTGLNNPNQQMIEVGNSDLYTNSFVIPRGTSIYMQYKYSVDGFDDENGFNTNHVREIRSYGPSYSFPQDVWSWTVMQPNNENPYPLAGIASTNIVEPDFGYLQIGAPSGGNLPITWLGRPAVLLQNINSLTGTWNTLSGTDATQSTNWPNGGGHQFFRLMKE